MTTGNTRPDLRCLDGGETEAHRDRLADADAKPADGDTKPADAGAQPPSDDKSAEPSELGGALPRVVTDALGSSEGVLASALARWAEAAPRLGLSPSAQTVGALLLTLELDATARATVLAEEASAAAPRRAHLLSGAQDVLSAEQAARGLVELELRAATRRATKQSGPWLAGELALEARVRGYCLGLGERSAQATLTPAAAALELMLAPPVAEALDSTAELARAMGERELLVIIRGRAGSGREAAVRLLLERLGRAPLWRSLTELHQPPDPLEPELSGRATVWDARHGDVSPADYDVAAKWLRRSPSVAVAVLDRHQDAPEVAGRQLVFVETDVQSLAERASAWRRVLHATGVKDAVAHVAAERLARRSRAGAGLAARAVQMVCPLQGQEAAQLVASVERALAALVRPSTTRGVVIERPEVPISRLVVSPEVSTSLQHVILLAETCAELGAEHRLGVKALFCGPSGTGKTMGARAVATALGLPLYRVDLAAVVSKWVGETEKNLRQALEAAESAGAVLLFDEGDALFAKRGEVDRGTDRYANLEVSYLLQAIELHDGLVIVTTNLRSQIDQGFERRFDVSVDFGRPMREQRAALWRQELGDAAAALDESFVRRQAAVAELTGGNIAAAARLARALAHRRGEQCVSKAEVLIAISAELRKMGAAVQAAKWSKRAEGDVQDGKEA